MAEDRAKQAQKAREKTEAKARRAAEKHARIAKEHAEFSAEARVEFLLGKFPEYKSRFGPHSTQYLDMLDELRQLSTRHPTVFVDRPLFRSLVESVGETSGLANPDPSLEGVPRPRSVQTPNLGADPSTTIDKDREREFHRQEREAVARRSRGRRSSSTGRARGTRVTRGRGTTGARNKGKLCIDDILNISSGRNKKSGED